MKWFKHDTDAAIDVKLKRVRMKYGMEGYGLYWYCLENIARGVDETKFTFELEEDAEIIAHDTGIHFKRIEEMMSFMVEQKLFEQSGGRISCLKLLKRMDQSMISSPKLRETIKNAKKNVATIMRNHDPIMTASEKSMQEKNRIEKNRIEEREREQKAAPAKKTSRAVSLPSDFAVTDVMVTWAAEQNITASLIEETDKFKDWCEANGKTYKNWTAAWRNWMRKANTYQTQNGASHERKLSNDQEVHDAIYNPKPWLLGSIDPGKVG